MKQPPPRYTDNLSESSPSFKGRPPGPLKAHWIGILTMTCAFALFALLASSFYTVPADSVGIVQRFGRRVATVGAGPHLKLPWGIDVVTRVPVLRQLKMEFGYQTPAASNAYQNSSEPEKDSDMVTGDKNSALVEWVIQYQISDPVEYLFENKDPEETLRALSEAAMREVIGDRTVDEVITFGRAEIESAALPLTQRWAKNYKLGIAVKLLQLKSIGPPLAVQTAFNDVNNAQQEKERMVNQATGEYNKVIPKARGEAKKAINEAKGYAAKRVNEAQGDADYFNQILKEYLKAPEVTRRRLYLETMTEVLPRVGQTILVDEKANQLVPLLNLNRFNAAPAGPAEAR